MHMDALITGLLLLAYGLVLLVPVFALSDYFKRRAEQTLGFKLRHFGRSHMVWFPVSDNASMAQRRALWKLNLKYLAITIPALFVWLAISLFGFAWIIFKIFGP
jgi:hypothetical protein